ncbi:hypothetical protein [Bradyrhizobium japonicum]|uniref:hypothetical protein n=1 Tax=Bradyrhizobium japonicum TaxID=375 RepID=UPI0004B61CFE|nr:hypothetical protein [Bradyrhizobium japonicum]
MLLRSGDWLLIAATMRDARPHVAQQPFGLNIAGFLVVPTSVDPSRCHTVPRIERISIVLSHLLLSGEAVAELVEYQISVHGRDAAD